MNPNQFDDLILPPKRDGSQYKLLPRVTKVIAPEPESIILDKSWEIQYKDRGDNIIYQTWFWITYDTSIPFFMPFRSNLYELVSVSAAHKLIKYQLTDREPVKIQLKLDEPAIEV